MKSTPPYMASTNHASDSPINIKNFILQYNMLKCNAGNSHNLENQDQILVEPFSRTAPFVYAKNTETAPDRA